MKKRRHACIGIQILGTIFEKNIAKYRRNNSNIQRLRLTFDVFSYFTMGKIPRMASLKYKRNKGFGIIFLYQAFWRKLELINFLVHEDRLILSVITSFHFAKRTNTLTNIIIFNIKLRAQLIHFRILLNYFVFTFCYILLLVTACY